MIGGFMVDFSPVIGIAVVVMRKQQQYIVGFSLL